jgi:hypothetical protein
LKLPKPKREEQIPGAKRVERQWISGCALTLMP